MESTEAKLKISDFNLNDKASFVNKKNKNNINIYSIALPLIVILLSLSGLLDKNLTRKPVNNFFHSETKGGEIKNAGKFNILSTEDLSGRIKDTVYTDKECWLELKINEQMLYQHWRNGKVEKYPISSGNNKGGDPEALESRPGLFAIFVKEEHHQSSQFNAANMYHFMPFNQGIGFHSIDGTGYYGHLGVRPSSHGCIRMRHEDAKKLFGDCPLGTLVLASKSYTARTIAFAPENFENGKEYTKEEYKTMLAKNLYNLVNGKYYVEEREKFIVDPKVIPVSGVYVSYDVEIPDKQVLPRSFVCYYDNSDKMHIKVNKEILMEGSSDEFINLVGNALSESDTNETTKSPVKSTDDLVKKYFNNPIGVLPYFGPKK